MSRYNNGACGLWVGLFIYSKIPELLDTVFLVLQKKRVIFLAWFHHTTGRLKTTIPRNDPLFVGEMHDASSTSQGSELFVNFMTRCM